MKVNNKHYRSIWYEKDSNTVKIIDQRELPYSFKVIDLDSLEDFRIAIKDMAVRGAPLIGATAAFGIAKQMQKDCTDKALDNAWEVLNATRPTAINLRWALNRCKDYLSQVATTDRAKKAMELALEKSDQDVEIKQKIYSLFDSGHVAERFEKMVSALGGPKHFLSTYKEVLPRAESVVPIKAKKEGFITQINTKALGNILIKMGGGRQKASDKLDLSVGFTKVVKSGKKVNAKTSLLFLSLIHISEPTRPERIACGGVGV